MLPSPNLTVGRMQSIKIYLPDIRYTQTRPYDCQTVKRDSSLQRIVFHMSTVNDSALYTIAIDAPHSVE
ncbi:hypothetical protein TNCV_3666181 [Trichonephila clavipes]|uniref:Uncharacterized protein n=1 Tax=Trichonephila clavipes TaxID=2585209 RepID=A0A8X6RXI3_TRICX|nr:hypothetical protein TNCV_3666181 [Trichonephila clavipes]